MGKTIAEVIGVITLNKAEVRCSGPQLFLHDWARRITRLKALNVGDVPVMLELSSFEFDMYGLQFMVEPFCDRPDQWLDLPLHYQIKPHTRIDNFATKMAPSPKPAVLCFSLRIESEEDE